MSPRAARPGIKVRGSCKAGHVTETTSEPGRLTWQGPCAHDGCDLKVNAKRIPRERPEQSATDQQTDDDSGIRIVRVDNYDDTSSGAQGDPGGVRIAEPERAEPEPADKPAGGGGDGVPAGGPPDPLDEHGQRRGALARLRDRRRTRRPAPHRHPLGIPLS